MPMRVNAGKVIEAARRQLWALSITCGKGSN